MRKWENLPPFMQVDEVRVYYDILEKHRSSLLFKRIFDIIIAGVLILILSPLFLILALIIKVDSKGPAIYQQTRVTIYGREFRIFKFRSMVVEADREGTQVTTNGDTRITRVGRVIRKYRLDELPQLVNILCGDMTFVGTRPEVVKYVRKYTDKMKATLLLPAGITSLASIAYKDEEKLLKSAEDADEIYIKQILPEKMKYNLKALREFSLWGDIKIMFRTVFAVLK
ncbi:sugar transferase [[Clostridium] hylemonae]|uniref:Bacterial sugar transferase n=1 Tax=[Clostridium] hylemonae DSM 15053 TaxID=553973 RepID=C0C2C3_9FIRM|nr:sugar transferase [[Clostridium] hylemonae]EEG73547.1 bacterial sugar transferase [[Clostridium] hylemonae DSM 15053]QEK17148.1 UDP-N-acetylgalactosamine-undecaprenyl-phosphate N-acetylgalactosaminephosphotransferase [[Clostridium] hylemonae DSM 15053]